jgi:PleD family two-component response regulator
VDNEALKVHPSGNSQPSSDTVLLIEADAAQAQSMQEELTRQGFAVVWSNSHLKALSILEDRKDLDLVLVMAEPTDIGGFEFIHLLRHRNRFADRWLQVIVMTTGEFFEGGPPNDAAIDDYLLRPYFPGELTWRVNKARQRACARRLQIASQQVDQGTGIYSSAGLEKALSEELRKISRKQDVLSLIIFQPQGLEDICLSYGLMTVEWMERDLAAAIRNSLRNYDRLGKLEGDRYCLLAPGVDSTQLPLLVKRLVQRVQNWNSAVARHSPIQTSLTLSLRAVTVVLDQQIHHLDAAVAALWNWISRTYAEGWPDSAGVVTVRLTEQGPEVLAGSGADRVGKAKAFTTMIPDKPTE